MYNVKNCYSYIIYSYYVTKWTLVWVLDWSRRESWRSFHAKCFVPITFLDTPSTTLHPHVWMLSSRLLTVLLVTVVRRHSWLMSTCRLAPTCSNAHTVSHQRDFYDIRSLLMEFIAVRCELLTFCWGQWVLYRIRMCPPPAEACWIWTTSRYRIIFFKICRNVSLLP
jgi:hypothetical protein